MKEDKNVFKTLTGKRTRKRPLRRSRCRWKENIRMNLKEIGVHMWNWIDSAQHGNYSRNLVNLTLSLRVL